MTQDHDDFGDAPQTARFETYEITAPPPPSFPRTFGHPEIEGAGSGGGSRDARGESAWQGI
ncbi:hypothetical protein [Streptomyces sp. cmx-4-9]|uniref:hypothetical protein n=1 Tax=Streptomyces sp. cmx-4-9 TaxID=2790941 RepID=UPI003980F71A